MGGGEGGLDTLGWIVAWQGRQIDMVILSIYSSSCPSKSRGEQEGYPTRDYQQYYGYTYWSVITVTDHSLSRSIKTIKVLKPQHPFMAKL